MTSNTIQIGGAYPYDARVNMSTFTVSSGTVSQVLNLPFITGTQCLHTVNGVTTGTGGDCASPAGGIVSPGTFTWQNNFGFNVSSINVTGTGVTGINHYFDAGTAIQVFGTSVGINKQSGGSALDVNGVIVGNQNINGLYFQSSDTGRMNYVLASAGSQNGSVDNVASNTWGLGWGNIVDLLGTEDLKWDSSPAVIVVSSMSVLGSNGLNVTYGTSVGSVTLRNVASGTQCLRADSSGNVTGTGSDCGSGTGSGGGIVSPGTFTWQNNGFGVQFSTIQVSSNAVIDATTFYQGGAFSSLESQGLSFDLGLGWTSNKQIHYNASTGQLGIGKTPGLSLDVNGEIRAVSDLLSPVFIQNTTLVPAVALDASGANFGLIENDASIAWSLAYGASSTSNGTPVLKWDSSPAVNILSSATIRAPTTNTYSLNLGTTSASNFNVAFSTNGFYVSNGPSPVISSCGSGPNGSVIGDDTQGVITVGGTAPTACTLTFQTVHTGCTMVCNVTDNSLTITADITSLTTSALTLGFGVGGLAGGNVWYRCSGFGNTCK